MVEARGLYSFSLSSLSGKRYSGRIPLYLFLLDISVPHARRAEAAGPPDCWTGTTDEKLLRITEKQLNRIAEERNALAEKAFERATFFGMGLPGSPQDQKDSIYLIFKDEIDELDLSQRLKTVRKWNKESEVGSPESGFWLMIVEETIRFWGSG
uniref:Uncharacterized protein n=1 Tax=Solanum tuberosum TaxID=4113 RepID=M1DW78_SOLTU